MRRRVSWALLPALLTLSALVLVPNPAIAQKTTGATVSVPVRKPAGRATRKVIAVTVASANGAVGMLKPDEGNATLTAFITAETKHYRGGAKLHQKTFVAGEKVVTRLAFYPDGTILVAEIWDPPLYEELLRLRKEVVVGTVETPLPPGSVSGTLVVKPEDEGPAVSYRVTDKTYFYRDDAPTSPATYALGVAVAVKPRALPSGGFMASIVAESEPALNVAYRDTLTRWEGILEKWDAPTFSLVLRRSDGVHRRVIFPKNLTITDEAAKDRVKDRRVYGPAEVIGRNIVVRLTRGERPGEGGIRTAVQITVGPVPASEVAVKPTEKPSAPDASDIKDYPLFYQVAVDKPYRIQPQGKSKPLEITFDTSRSDTMALSSLLALSATVLHPNAEGRIILQGKIVSGSGKFLLKHWYLAPPIRKRIAKASGEAEEATSPGLSREDFRATATFDPQDKAFDPAIYTRPLHLPVSQPPGKKPPQ